MLSTPNYGDTDHSDNTILPVTQIRCEAAPDDSDENADGSVAWIPTQRFRPAAYRKLVTRYTDTGIAVSVDYLLYEPDNKPRGLIVLLTGGALNAGIKSKDGRQISRSGANFLIRSAHFFADRGYRVIGMNRPDDYRAYGEIETRPDLYDSYRTSMAHAVDIAMLIQQHAVAKLPVIFIGSSRGAISAFAQQALADIIVLAGPVTSGAGTPLAVSTAVRYSPLRPAVILTHQADACPASQPRLSHKLAETLYQYNTHLTFIELSGGIRDSAADDPCATLDHHGFTGIESCTVNSTLDAVEKLVATFPENDTSVMTQEEYVSATPGLTYFYLRTHTTVAKDTLRYFVPTQYTVLGGKLTIDSHTGKVSYLRPADRHNVTDRFVYNVSNAAGNVNVGIVSLLLR